MEIFNFLRPPEDKPLIDQVHMCSFSRVALICQFFCSVMLPWMFESIQLGRLNEFSNHAPFCWSLIDGCGSAQIIATYIKRCSFWRCDEDYLSSPQSILDFRILCAKALALMPNLEELILWCVCITKNLLKSMKKLKCLTSLSLCYCPLSKVRDRDIRKLSVLRLKSLRYFSILPDEGLLLTSYIRLDSLLKLNTNHGCFLTRIAEQDFRLP